MNTQMFGSEDFKSLRYDVINIKGDVLEAVPKLRKFSSFASCDRKIRDKAIRLTVLFYDKNSPLVKQFRDIDMRWKEAAKIAGFDPIRDSTLLDTMYNFTPTATEWDDEGKPTAFEPCFFENMAIEYLVDQGDLYWFMINSNEKTFFEFQKAAQQIVESFSSDKDKLTAISVKGKLLEESHVIAERLESYYAKVFGEGEISKRAKLRSYSPEKVAHGV